MLELKNIKKDYVAGDTIVPALKGVSIDFRTSEFVSILGPSGCGKTTLLNIIGGLDRYTSGDIIINNRSTKDFKDYDWDTYRNHSVGFVFQNYNLITHLTVLENVEIALSLAGISRDERKKRATIALESVGLHDQINKKPNQLSGGQMQRVAIARSIVANPDILLADEPTGALDSETSVQIMEILKEISKDRLIIMVTHNSDLAEKYSTRIINLLDGEITSDNNPYNHAEEFAKEQKEQVPNKADEPEQQNKKKKVVKERKTSMNFWTAMRLSFKNLLTKKWRTFMTSFAGSIGIIGIALIVSVSNGFTGYINKIQSDTLSGYPISVSTVSVDMNAVQNVMTGGFGGNKNEFPNDNNIVVKDNSTDLASLSHYNFLSPGFVEYIKQYEQADKEKREELRTLNNVQYSHAAPLNILTMSGNNNVQQVNTSISNNPLSGTSSSVFMEALNNAEFVNQQYDVLYGHYPQDKNEVALVIGSRNEMSKSLLDALGINYTQNADLTYEKIDFASIVSENGKEFKLINNDDYYVYDNATDSFSKRQASAELYNNPNNITLKVSGILRVNPESATELFSSGIIYLPELTTHFNEASQSSQIVTKQRENTTKLYVPFDIGIQMPGIPTFTDFATLKAFVKISYGVTLTNETATEYALQSLGASSIPTSIQLYPKTFKAKDKIISHILAWNNTEEGKTNKIAYSDVTQTLSDTMGQMVNIISYVLIAFAAISLVVSSIMIAIITYVSVLERTKEIGVLRSIGARKKDITRVFNAETFLVGLTSGLLGVGISFVLTFPISAIIKAVAGGAITTQMAIMDPISAIILVAISTLLTMVSGLIPAIMAANRDPVKALRSE